VEPLQTIGSFARAVGLTTSALRYYDECGLLPPAEVDQTTGYRYYTPELGRRARLLAVMREAGVPVETMRVVLDADPEQAQGALREMAELRAEKAARERAAIDEVLDAMKGAQLAQPEVRLDGPELASALRQVRVAAVCEPASPLASITIDAGPAGVDVVATNRYWMAVRTLSRPATAPARVVLDLDAAAGMAAALDSSDDVTVTFDRGGIRVDGARWEGRSVAYPAHRLILDGLEPPTTRAVLNASELAETLRTAGRAEVNLPLEGASVRGPAMNLRFSTALLRRGLAACLGAEVIVEAIAPDRPVRLRSPYQPGFVAIVMPTTPE
jgi:DNA-binding transcriptional MerR regulator